MASPPSNHRAGFVAIVGRPNVGKSTLLNRLLGEKIAIVSPRPQTTRSRIMGVLNGPAHQVAFFDTPGIHKAVGALNQFMVDAALHTLDEVDAVLHLVEPGVTSGGRVQLGEEQRWIAGRVVESKKPALLAINKIDTVPKPLLLPVIDAWRQAGEWKAIVPISAAQGDGVEQMLAELVKLLPEGPPLFPPDVLTDQAERAIVGEYVREAVLHLTHQEVPHSVAVVVESFDESERADVGKGRKGLVRIEATTYVERESQKAIVIGKGGSMLKKIGSQARKQIEHLLGCRVWLGLHVKVEKDWTRRPELLARMGYLSRG